MAFFRMRSVWWLMSLTIDSEMAVAMVELRMRSREVRHITTSCTLALLRSFWMVETSMMVRSEFLLRKSEQRR